MRAQAPSLSAYAGLTRGGWRATGVARLSLCFFHDCRLLFGHPAAPPFSYPVSRLARARRPPRRRSHRRLSCPSPRVRSLGRHSRRPLPPRRPTQRSLPHPAQRRGLSFPPTWDAHSAVAAALPPPPRPFLSLAPRLPPPTLTRGHSAPRVDHMPRWSIPSAVPAAVTGHPVMGWWTKLHWGTVAAADAAPQRQRHGYRPPAVSSVVVVPASGTATLTAFADPPSVCGVEDLSTGWPRPPNRCPLWTASLPAAGDAPSRHLRRRDNVSVGLVRSVGLHAPHAHTDDLVVDGVVSSSSARLLPSAVLKRRCRRCWRWSRRRCRPSASGWPQKISRLYENSIHFSLQKAQIATQ